MPDSRFEQAMHGFKGVFSEPQEIEGAADLTRLQKIELLRQWEQDLRQRLSAAEEGMKASHPGEAAETLRQVERALRQIDVG